MNLSPLRRALKVAVQRGLPFTRRMTIGAQAVVIDPQGRIFLVKHSYVSGRHLPGGGVEIGETLLQALERELLEEGGIAATEPPMLHGVFLNSRVSRRDHMRAEVRRLPFPNAQAWRDPDVHGPGSGLDRTRTNDRGGSEPAQDR